MSNKIIKEKGGDLTKLNQTENAVRIVGAVLNNDSKSLFEIIEKHKTDYQIQFLAISGIFHLLSKAGKNYSEVLRISHFEKNTAFKKIKSLLSEFYYIFESDNYNDYPVPVLPNSKISKNDFLTDAFAGIFHLLINDCFVANQNRFSGNDAFEKPETINLLLNVILKTNIIDSEYFFKNVVIKQTNNVLDCIYIEYFSNAKTKIWDSRRAAREYFLRKIITFNPLFLEKNKKLIDKRWQAWFILEDQYKTTGKKVDRKKLLAEMQEILVKL